MELRVEEVQVPEKIPFNYEELKTQLTTRCEEYRTIVYTPDTIKEAKADRAMLNKLKDSLNTERIRRQKEYMRPFETFKNQIDELIGIINTASGAIDTQVKSYEEEQKKEKEAEIQVIFAETDFPDFVMLDQIRNPKWLNKSYTLSMIRKDMEDRAKVIAGELVSINGTFEGDDDASAFGHRVASEIYAKSLDLSQAMYEGSRTVKMVRDEAERKRKAEEEAQKKEQEAQNPEPPVKSEPPRNENAETRERAQRVVVEIIAKESQFEIMNDLFLGMKQAGVQYRMIKKEEL